MTSKFRPLPSKDTVFEKTAEALNNRAVLSTDRALLAKGDCVEVMKEMPDDSVSLILTDPPYHSTKKGNIYGDRAFKEDEHFLEWMIACSREWQRILRPNGTLYVFCSSKMAARLEVALSDFFRPIAQITWTKPNLPGYDGWKGKMKKEALRSWYPHSERILVFEHGAYGSYEAYRRSPMGQYLRDQRQKAGLTMNVLTEMVGAYGKVNHGGAVANWEAGRNIPSLDQYKKICEALESYGVEKMVSYFDLVRPMFLNGEIEFTDVWNYPSARPFRGKHPAEKPREMLREAILASSYPDDVVLDCFAGSGSTAVAALEVGRRAVAIEIEDQWVERASNDLEAVLYSSEGASGLTARSRLSEGEWSSETSGGTLSSL